MKSFSTASLSNQDITSVLSVHTWAATRDLLMIARVVLTNLSASSNARKLLTYIDGALADKYSLNDASSPSAVALFTEHIPVKSGEQVELKVQGVSGDTLADVASEIFGVDAMNGLDLARPASPVASSPLEDLQRSRARLSNKVTENVNSRLLSVKDDAGTAELFSLTPSETGGVITLTPG